MLQFGVNYQLQLVGLRMKREEGVQPTCFVSKATLDTQTNHSHWALNLIVKSKSLPVDLNDSTIELLMPSRQKKSLQSYCSVDFDFLALIRFVMTFDAVTLHDGLCFGKCTNSCH